MNNYEVLCTRLIGFLRLKYNWDSYNGHLISLDTVESALDLLFKIPPDLIVHAQLVPCGSGGVQFEIQYKDRELEFEITPDRMVEWLTVEPDDHECTNDNRADHIQKEGESRLEDFDLNKYVSWLKNEGSSLDLRGYNCSVPI